MNIDEFIEHAKEKAREHRYHADFFESDNPMNTACIKSAEDCEQLAEWLEELKELRNMTAGHLYAVAFNRGYLKAEKEVREKAIDDFAENIRLYYSLKQEMGYVATTYEDLINYIFDLAEQLKAGEQNESV